MIQASSRVSSLQFRKIKTLQCSTYKIIIQYYTITVCSQILPSLAISSFKDNLKSTTKIKRTLFQWRIFLEIRLKVFLLKMSTPCRNSNTKNSKNEWGKLNKIQIWSKTLSRRNLKIISRISIINLWELARNQTGIKVFHRITKVFHKTLLKINLEMNK